MKGFSKETFKISLFVLDMLWKASKWMTIVFFAISLLSGLVTILEVWVIAKMVNELIRGFGGNAAGSTLRAFIPWILLLIGAMIAKEAISSVQPLLSALLKERIDQTLKKRCLTKALSVDLVSFESQEYYDKLQRSNKAKGRGLVHALEMAGGLITTFVEFIVIAAAVTQVNYQQSPLQYKTSGTYFIRTYIP
jgi:ABC-type multidrug transport system fused ATPase/permease subunit